MTQEALKLALEFLEDNQHYVADNERLTYVMMYNAVIEKCKEALAQHYKVPPPCPTCEALARSVMMDQTGRDA